MVDVVDGDTITVSLDGRIVRVRYIGIDAPEMGVPESSPQWMGPEASTFNASLLFAETLYLEKDVSEEDPEGRLLRYVWLRSDGWSLVNLILVENGYAVASRDGPDARYQDALEEAERDAMRLGQGLWSPTPAQPAGGTGG